MADSLTPQAPSATEEPQKQDKPILDSTKPLSQQTAILNSLADAIPEKKEEDEQPTEKEEKVENDKGPESLEQVIDDDEEEEEQSQLELPKGTWQEYVFEKLPAIKAHLVIDGKNKVLDIKSFNQMPAHYEWQSTAARDAFFAAYTGQETRAERLKNEFDSQVAQVQSQQFEQKQNIDIANDIEWLQKQGILPEFKYDSTDAKFNSDPAVKETNEIYTLWKKKNDEYASINQKRMASDPTQPLYRISFKEAAYEYYMNKTKNNGQNNKTSIQQERQKIATRTGGSPGAEPSNQKPKAYSGMTQNDVYRLFKAGRI
jgi:hypothetical protein